MKGDSVDAKFGAFPTREDYERYGLRPEMPRVFDHSASQAFADCKRLFYYEYLLGRRPKELKHGLAFGSAWHKMHEAVHEGKPFEEALSMADTYIPEQTDDRYGRTRDRIKEAFEKYRDQYGEVDGRIFKIVHIEQAAEAKCEPDAECYFGGCNLFYGGRPDRFLEAYHKVWLLDYKTTTREDDFITDKYTIDHQMLGYIWLGTHLLGERVWGVMIDWAKINKSSIDLKRIPISVSDAHIMEFVYNERARQEDARLRFEKYAYNMEQWEQNPNHCFAWGRCPFHERVCTVAAFPDIKTRLKILSEEYTEHRWNFYKP